MVILTLAAGGALDRFPGLKVVTVETGASWLAWIMTQADAIYADHSMWAQPEAVAEAERAHPPPVLGHLHVRPGRDQQPSHTGIETLMWGNDYPHPEGTWPESRPSTPTSSTASPDADLAAIVSGNAARVFGFDLDQLAKLQPVPA